MERNHGEAAARHQQLLSRGKTAVELAELVVYRDPKGLECAGCRVMAPFGLGHRSTHDIGEFDCPPDRSPAPRRDDRAGDPTGKALFA
jgi:hypothetical protein